MPKGTAVRFDPAGPLWGELRPPPDKSISHRAALIGAMSTGPTRISGYLDSADTRATLRAVAAVGAGVIEGEPDGRGGFFVEVEGVELRGARSAQIDVGNAGTLLRILPGWLAGQPQGEWTLDGDESIRRRPVDRVTEPLALMGAEVEARDGRLPPLRVRGSSLKGMEYELPVASAQVKSCLLLAGLLADSETTVREPAPSRDHTERMLAAAGAELRRTEHGVTIQPAEQLESGDVAVPGDFSSAAFFLVAGLIVPGSELRLVDVGINRNRIGLLTVLDRMGLELGEAGKVDAAVTVDAIQEPGPEPVATLGVRPAPLTGTTVRGDEVPALIDELPLVALLGCFAEGETVVSGAEELRHKESDRIAAVVDGLSALGAEIEAAPDGFTVRGTGNLRGGSLDARGDHRMAMLGAVAGLASEEGVEVTGFDAVSVSYPGFEGDVAAVTGSS